MLDGCERGSSKQSDLCFHCCLNVCELKPLCTVTWGPLAFCLLPKWKSLCASWLSSRVVLRSVATLASGEGSIYELCVASVEPLAFLCIYLLQIRNAFSKPSILGGRNNEQQSNGITFHRGTVYCCFLWGLIRMAPSQVKAPYLLLFGTTNGYIGCNMFEPAWRLSLLWKIQTLGLMVKCRSVEHHFPLVLLFPFWIWNSLSLARSSPVSCFQVELQCSPLLFHWPWHPLLPNNISRRLCLID